MKFALSTNWCSRRYESGEEIADKALELGFDALELGFNTTMQQVAGFKRRLDKMPVGSVHAFCPVPLSAPRGYPELYQLASFDAEARKMAQIQIRRNVAFAAEMGAGAVVLHAGRVYGDSFLTRILGKRGIEMCERNRVKRGQKMIDILKKELELLAPELEKAKVTIGLENLPYAAGFPNENEIASVAGEWVKPWFDTGHWYALHAKAPVPDSLSAPIGMHINDSEGGDDHLPPGKGRIDFNDLKPLMMRTPHLVLEPHSGVDEAALKQGLEFLRGLE